MTKGFSVAAATIVIVGTVVASTYAVEEGHREGQRVMIGEQYDASDVNWETYLDNTKTWTQAEAQCNTATTHLCSQAELCPSGSVAGGTKSGDQWVPVSDSTNTWVAVGNAYPSRTCGTHQQCCGGKPSWGQSGTHAFKNYVACCTPAPTPGPTTPAPTPGPTPFTGECHSSCSPGQCTDGGAHSCTGGSCVDDTHYFLPPADSDGSVGQCKKRRPGECTNPTVCASDPTCPDFHCKIHDGVVVDLPDSDDGVVILEDSAVNPTGPSLSVGEPETWTISGWVKVNDWGRLATTQANPQFWLGDASTWPAYFYFDMNMNEEKTHVKGIQWVGCASINMPITPPAGISLKWTFGTVMHDSRFFFEWYVNGALIQKVPLPAQCTYTPHGTTTAVYAAPGSAGKALTKGFRITTNEDFLQLIDWRYYTTPVSAARARLPENTYVNLNHWTSSVDGLPCSIEEAGRTFYMANVTSRTGFCTLAHSNALPMCVKSGGTTACTKTLAVPLSPTMAMVPRKWTESEFPVVASLPQRTKDQIETGYTTPVNVRQGAFSKANVFFARFAKRTICVNQTCTTSKSSACIECPYPAINYDGSFGPWGRPPVSRATSAFYIRDCMMSSKFCEMGTAEYELYTDIVALA